MTISPTENSETFHALLQRLEYAESRLQALEDEREIRELLSRYGHHADAARDQAYVDLFTLDGAIDISMGGDGDYAQGLRFEGTEALWKFITDPKGHHRPGFYGNSMHVQNTNTVVRVDGDDAVAVTYSILIQQVDGEVRIVGAGTNRWTFRRVDERWLISERRRRELGHPDTDRNLSLTEW